MLKPLLSEGLRVSLHEDNNSEVSFSHIYKNKILIVYFLCVKYCIQYNQKYCSK